MYRVDNPSSSAVYNPGVRVVGPNPDHYYTDPAGAVPGTIVDADHLTALQEELAAVVERVAVLDKTDDGQLEAAIGGAVALVAGPADTGGVTTAEGHAVLASSTSRASGGAGVSAVVGSSLSHASADASCVIGAAGSTASGVASAIAGGSVGTASGIGSAVLGGDTGTASGDYSATVGGDTCTAAGDWSACAGGVDCSANGNYSAVCGGDTCVASAARSVVLGGDTCTASGTDSGVLASVNSESGSGGSAVIASDTSETSGAAASVLSGYDCEASGVLSAVVASKYTTCATAQALALGDDPGGVPARAAANQTIRLEAVGGNINYEGALNHGPVADFAEMFETDAVLPAGAIVTLAGDRAVAANAGDTPIGVVSVAPGLVGNTAWAGWSGRWEMDAFGRRVTDRVPCVRWSAVTAPNPARAEALAAVAAARESARTALRDLGARHKAAETADRARRRDEADALRLDAWNRLTRTSNKGEQGRIGEDFRAALAALRQRHKDEREALRSGHGDEFSAAAREHRATVADLRRALRQTPETIETRTAYDGPADAAPGPIPDDAVRFERDIPRQSPEWDPARPYTPRRERPAEWCPVALTGLVRVRVDETVGKALAVGTGPVYLLPSADAGVGRAATAEELPRGGATLLVLGLAAPGVARALVR